MTTEHAAPNLGCCEELDIRTSWCVCVKEGGSLGLRTEKTVIFCDHFQIMERQELEKRREA